MIELFNHSFYLMLLYCFELLFFMMKEVERLQAIRSFATMLIITLTFYSLILPIVGISS